MKSVFLSFFIFLIVFIVLRSDILSVVSTNIFSYITFGAFLLVIGCALYFVGIPKTSENSPEPNEETKESDDEK